MYPFDETRRSAIDSRAESTLRGSSADALSDGRAADALRFFGRGATAFRFWTPARKPYALPEYAQAWYVEL